MGRRRAIAALAFAGVAAVCLGNVPVQAGANPIRERFPAQWAATQTDAANTKHWALIIGITAYQSPTHDTLGGKRDAEQVRAHLINLGWHKDHILTLFDGNATKSMVLGGLAWLRSKAQPGATVVFSYAGHEMPFRTDDDGDSEYRDVALHLSDNRYILDGDLARILGEVRESAMWIHFATCRAEGFNDAGLMQAGRVATFSSVESELSFEDPEGDYSVFGKYTVVQAMRQELADYNDDGKVSVEEAFRFGKPRVWQRTSDCQHPVLIDRVDGQLVLRPGAPVV